MKGRTGDIITAGELHLMHLVQKDAKPDGWTSVSKTVWPAVLHVSDRLMEKEPNEKGGGRVRLTHDGRIVLEFSGALRKGVGK